MLEKLMEWIAKPLIERIAALESQIAAMEAVWPQVKESNNVAD